MRNAVLVAGCLVAVTACGSSAASGVVTAPEPGSPFIAFNVWVKAGSQNDPPGKEGLASLTGYLLSDSGTTEDSYQAILEKFYPMATGYQARVDKEMSVFTGTVHRDNLEAFYELFRNHLLSPAFDPGDFDRVKTQLLNYLERQRRYGRDEELTRELLSSLAFAGTPYGHPVEGYVQSVRSITVDDVKAFYAQYYRSGNVVVGLAGGYPDGFVDKVRADFDTLPDGDVPVVEAPRPRMPEGAEVLIVEKPTDATPVSIGFPIDVTRGDADFVPLLAATSWLGEHRNPFSHLYQVIREKRGINYGDYAYIEALPGGFATQQPPVNIARRSQLFEIWIRPVSMTAPGNLHDRTLFTTRAALRELHALADGGMTAESLAATQQFLGNYSTSWGDTLTRRLGYAIDDRFYGIDDGYLARLQSRLGSLAVEDVNAVVRRHLQSENCYVVFITRDAEAFKAKLLSGEPTPITYASEPSAEIKAEDAEIERFPIPVRADKITIVPIDTVFETGEGAVN